MNLTLSLTHDCNLACTYCYAGAKRRASMPAHVADRAVDFAFSFGDPKIQVGFFGGEPLLEWDRLQAATLAAETRAEADGVRLKKTLTTNASLVTPDRAEWLAAHEFYLGVSIDGNRAMHDITRPSRGGTSSFDACLAGMETLLPHIPDLEAIVVPSPANVCHLADGVRYLIEERGVCRVSVNPNFYTEWPDSALDAMKQCFEEIGDAYLGWYRAGRTPHVNFIDGKIITGLKNGFECRDRCGFGEREIAVAPSGRVYPCERLVAEDTGGEMCIGHVDSGFDEDRRRAILQRRGNVNPECAACAIASRCMNWCCCINYTLTGAIDQTDGIVCFHERAAAETADRVGGALFAERCRAFLSRFYYEDFRAVEDPTSETGGPA